MTKNSMHITQTQINIVFSSTIHFSFLCGKKRVNLFPDTMALWVLILWTEKTTSGYGE